MRLTIWVILAAPGKQKTIPRATHLSSCIRQRRPPVGVLRYYRFWTEHIRGADVADAPTCVMSRRARRRWRRSPRAGVGNRLRLPHSRFSRGEQPNKLHPFICRWVGKVAGVTVVGQGIRQRPQNQSALSFIDYDVIFAASRQVRYDLAIGSNAPP